MKKELWQQGYNLAVVEPEEEPIRLKPHTKAWLVERFKKGGNNMSPIIGTEVKDGADEVTEEVKYQITNVEELTTEAQNLKGIRVSLVDEKGRDGNVMLWQRPITGKGSKLGVFLTVLGNNTDKWLHKWIVFHKWMPREREMEVIPAPVPKAKLAKK